MAFTDELKRLRKNKKLTQQQLADGLGLSASTIGMYEQGRRAPDFETLELIADYFNINIGSLLETDTEKKILTGEAIPYSPTKRIPILGTISAGLPLYAEEHIEGYTYTDLNHGNEYFGLRVKGDSMTAARIYEGDIVIIKRQNYIENGEIAVVLVGDDEATVKRYYQEEGSPVVTLTPQSYNPEHKPQNYDVRKTKIRILGKVVRVQIDF